MASPKMQRRLSDLLEEQQEPFLLDIYLLEHGLSDTRLENQRAAGGLCWPAKSCRRLVYGSGFRRRHGGLLQCLLAKLLLNGKLVKKRRYDEQMGSRHFPCCFNFTTAGPTDKFHSQSSSLMGKSCGSDGGGGGEIQMECGDDKSLLFSPVSILELLSSESSSDSSAPESYMEDFDAPFLEISDELLKHVSDSSSSPIIHRHFHDNVKKTELDLLKKLAADCESEAAANLAKNTDFFQSYSYKTMGAMNVEQQLCLWQKQRGSLARMAHLFQLDILISNKEWRSLTEIHQELCWEIVDDILEDMLEGEVQVP